MKSQSGRMRRLGDVRRLRPEYGELRNGLGSASLITATVRNTWRGIAFSTGESGSEAIEMEAPGSGERWGRRSPATRPSPEDDLGHGGGMRDFCVGKMVGVPAGRQTFISVEDAYT